MFDRYHATTQFLREHTLPVEYVVALRSEALLLAQRVIAEEAVFLRQILWDGVRLKPVSVETHFFIRFFVVKKFSRSSMCPSMFRQTTATNRNSDQKE